MLCAKAAFAVISFYDLLCLVAYVLGGVDSRLETSIHRVHHCCRVSTYYSIVSRLVVLIAGWSACILSSHRTECVQNIRLENTTINKEAVKINIFWMMSSQVHLLSATTDLAVVNFLLMLQMRVLDATG